MAHVIELKPALDCLRLIRKYYIRNEDEGTGNKQTKTRLLLGQHSQHMA
jgi:hypothetical protein